MHGLKKLFHATAMQMKSKACSCRKHGKGKASLAYIQSKHFYLLFVCLIIQFTLGHGDLIMIACRTVPSCD